MSPSRYDSSQASSYYISSIVPIPNPLLIKPLSKTLSVTQLSTTSASNPQNLRLLSELKTSPKLPSDASTMCYKIIEDHPCGHKTEDPIPCEGMMDSGTCTAAPEATHDNIKNVSQECRNCQAEQADEAAFEEAMRKIAEDPGLAPEPRTAVYKSPDNLGPMKQRTRWKRCGHVGDPKELEAIRESPDDPEWLETEEVFGNCWGCSAAHPSLLAEMKAAGKLDCDDPWGAMEAPAQVAAGGSSRAGAGQDAHPAFRVPDIDGHGEGFNRSRSPSPDQFPTLTRGKGKGRADRPEETYASRHGAPEPVGSDTDSEHEHEHDSDDDSRVHSGDEDDYDVKPAKSKHPLYELSDSDEDDTRGRKPRKQAFGSSSRGSSSKSAPAHRARSRSSSYSQDRDHDRAHVPDWSATPPPGGPPPRNPARLDAGAAMASGALPPQPSSGPIINISPEERTKYKIPPNVAAIMTQARFDAWKEMVAKQGRLAMEQSRDGVE